jgi:hypothetical protein
MLVAQRGALRIGYFQTILNIFRKSTQQSCVVSHLFGWCAPGRTGRAGQRDQGEWLSVDGVEGTKRLHREPPSIMRLAPFVPQDALMEDTMRAAGFADYLNKDSAADQLSYLIMSATGGATESMERQP